MSEGRAVRVAAGAVQGEAAVAVRREIGGLIRAARERARLSQSRLAGLVGVDVSTVSRWESGARWPMVPNLLGIAAACRVSPGELLPATATPGPAGEW